MLSFFLPWLTFWLEVIVGCWVGEHLSRYVDQRLDPFAVTSLDRWGPGR